MRPAFFLVRPSRAPETATRPRLRFSRRSDRCSLGRSRELARAAAGYGGRLAPRAGDDPRLVPLLEDALLALAGSDDELRLHFSPASDSTRRRAIARSPRPAERRGSRARPPKRQSHRPRSRTRRADLRDHRARHDRRMPRARGRALRGSHPDRRRGADAGPHGRTDHPPHPRQRRTGNGRPRDRDGERPEAPTAGAAVADSQRRRDARARRRKARRGRGLDRERIRCRKPHDACSVLRPRLPAVHARRAARERRARGAGTPAGRQSLPRQACLSLRIDPPSRPDGTKRGRAARISTTSPETSSPSCRSTWNGCWQ